MFKGGTPKVPRKSTHIDMTAFCDVTFLLLTFFMLATKFKAPEPVEIVTPSSVSTKSVPEDNVISIVFDSSGRIFLTMDKVEQKINLLTYLNTERKLGLDPEEILKAANEPFFGYPLAGIRSFLNGEYGSNLPGIPSDSTQGTNELSVWIAALITTYQSKSKRPDILIKGDINSKYPSFVQIIDTFKKNRLFSFKLVTGQEAVPEGTPLYIEQTAGKSGYQSDGEAN